MNDKRIEMNQMIKKRNKLFCLLSKIMMLPIIASLLISGFGLYLGINNLAGDMISGLSWSAYLMISGAICFGTSSLLQLILLKKIRS